ncbi:hypothetical protein L218DRAFT_947013 [Marasmius fiardii PR-910]|nr:hypothetical protein L218DRAFT_947013 [Marasmius fiardii PR-910]
MSYWDIDLEFTSSHNQHGWKFLTNVIKQYPLGKHLAYRLRALGSPARTSPDTIDKVLDIVGAISANMYGIGDDTAITRAEALIVSNWTSTFEPWVKFLLQNVILATEGPSDLSSVIRVENALVCLPGFLTFREIDQDSESSSMHVNVNFMTTIGQISPEIPRLAAEVWTKILGDHHPAWCDWTQFMTFIIQSLPLGSGVYEGNHQIGLAFISHLNHQTQRMSELTWDEMRTLKTSFLLMDEFTFKGESPLLLDSIRRYSLPAVIKLLSSALRRRPKNEDLAECVYGIGSQALRFLLGLMTDYHWVSEALQHGFVEAILNIHPSIYEWELTSGTGVDVEALSKTLPVILKRVSCFMLYQSVLHPFSSVSRKISRSGKLEKRMKENSEVVYDAWMKTKKIASTIRNVRRRGKKDGSLNLCRSVQCPRKCSEAVEETALTVQYYSCTGCSSVLYCSHACQKLDWKDGHREECPTMQISRPLPGDPDVRLPNYDTVFFDFWAKDFFTKHPQLFQDRVGEYLAQLKRISQSHQSGSQGSLEAPAQVQLITPDQQAILDRMRNPVVLVEFLDCPSLELLDSATGITQYGTEPADTEEIISQWHASEVTEIMMMACFPVQPSCWMHMWFKLPFGSLDSVEKDGDGDDRDRYLSDEDRSLD